MLLDAQRDRLKPHFEYLRSMVKAISEGHKSLQDLIDSEDFPNMLDGLDKDAPR